MKEPYYRMVISKNEIPPVHQDVLRGLGFSQDTFVEYVVFTLPYIDIRNLDDSIFTFLDELVSEAINPEEPYPEWVGFLYDEYFKVAQQLSRYIVPYLDNLHLETLSKGTNVLVEGLFVSNESTPAYYVIEFDLEIVQPTTIQHGAI
jgi:hypothetical protein